MKRQEAIDLIKSMATPAIMDELEYYLEGFDREDPYDFLDAFEDFSDYCQFAEGNALKKEAQWCLEVEVALGIYKPISDEDAKEACRNGLNVTMRSFPKLKGQRYECGRSWESFIESLEP
jgi:hypothetical protein